MPCKSSTYPVDIKEDVLSSSDSVDQDSNHRLGVDTTGSCTARGQQERVEPKPDPDTWGHMAHMGTPYLS